eukprot:gene11372-23802_t
MRSSIDDQLEEPLNIHILDLGDKFLSTAWSYMSIDSKLEFSSVNKATRRKFKNNSLNLDCFIVSKEFMFGTQAQNLLSRDMEKNSFDEFDDFISRHPNPKGKNSHRRGDSLFNSDIEQAADKARKEEYGNMSMLASLALKAEQMDNIPSFVPQHKHKRF